MSDKGIDTAHHLESIPTEAWGAKAVVATVEFDLIHDQGWLVSNCDSGIYGMLTEDDLYENRDALQVGRREDVREGPATILSNVEGIETEEYDVRILKIYGGGQGRELLLEIVIHEGKNRQIRRMCRQCGLEVARLQRVAEHTVVLGGLKAGTWRYLTKDEVQKLKGSDKA